MPQRLGAAVLGLATFTAAQLGLFAPGQLAEAQTAPGKAATSLRCDDWKKLGAHRWIVVKEVMLGTAWRTGTIVENTPETEALDARCAK